MLRFIAREHRRRPFAGPVLTLGRQYVYATLDEAREIVRSEGLEPKPLPAHIPAKTNIPQWAGTTFERFTSDRAFFALLGLEVRSVDVDAFEGAEIVHDMNLPVPDELGGRFDPVIDGGTLEHVFDVRQALRNIASLARKGGRVIHSSPSNNYLNHGFYQFSPTLFFDYYAANSFKDLRGWLVLETGDVRSNVRRPWDIFPLPPTWAAEQRLAITRQMASTVFVAEKTETSTSDARPKQAFYASYHGGSPTASLASAPKGGSLRGWLKSVLPEPVRRKLREYLLVTYPDNRLPEGLRWFIIRHVPGLDSSKKPWGLPRRERLS